VLIRNKVVLMHALKRGNLMIFDSIRSSSMQDIRNISVQGKRQPQAMRKEQQNERVPENKEENKGRSSYLSIYLSIHYTCLSISLSINLSIYLSAFYRIGFTPHRLQRFWPSCPPSCHLLMLLSGPSVSVVIRSLM